MKIVDDVTAARPEEQWLAPIIYLMSMENFISYGTTMYTLMALHESPNFWKLFNSIKDFDTGGIFGVPISISANSVPVGRVYQYDGANKTMKPVSDWIKIAK